MKAPGLPSPTRPKLFWEGDFVNAHSLARVNRGVSLALLRREDVNLTVVPVEAAWPDAPELRELTAAHVRHRGLDPRAWGGMRPLWVRHTFPLRARRPPRVRLVQMLPWEFSRLPIALADILNAADEVWTTSSYSRAALVASGVPADHIHIVGNGFDPAVFRPEGPRETRAGSSGLLFVYVGGTIYRKGVDLLVRAFMEAFAGREDVTLLIKDNGVSDVYKGATIGDWIRDQARTPGAPPILYVDEPWPEVRVASLYRSADALVAPYRGEGFHLPSLEAMACGIPVVVTAGGATDDFVDEAVGWRIPAVLRPAGGSVFGMEVRGEAHLYEPVHSALVGILREVAASREERKRRGAAGHFRAHNAWTWQQMARKVMERVTGFLPVRS